MALFGDSVPREMYEDMRQQRDAAQQRFDDLLAKYHALRPMQSPVNPLRVIPPKPDSAAQTLDAVEHAARDPRLTAAVEKMLAEKPGMSATVALREAKTLLDVATGKADAPPLPTTTIGAALL